MTGIAHLSEMASLALHSMTLIAGNQREMLNVKEIAKQIGASEAHLSKVLQRLVKTGLLRSTRGPNGGFELTRPGTEITLWDIYEAVEGAGTGEGCPSGRPFCPFQKCLFGGVLEKINTEFGSYLKSQTLQDFGKYL
ncbi:MAG TPA: Rrf2 family transcriptional regulator [Bacillota bacterium]|nr:Rrf2 family transcriptional regulator [Bacillota bacterium]